MEDEISFANRTKTENAGQNQTSDVHTNEQYFECKLLNILNGVKAPHYWFQSIMEWAHDVTRAGSKSQPKRTTRKAHIQNLKIMVDSTCIVISTAITNHATQFTKQTRPTHPYQHFQFYIPVVFIFV